MNNIEFVNKAKNIAENYKTAYVWGAFGFTANAANMQRLIDQYSKNNQYLAKARQIYGNGFFFDCVGLIKSILWGFNGNKNATYGGAKYTSNGVNDISADQMINICKGVSTDFKNIEVGEVVWLPGHIGIYIGDGNVVEAYGTERGVIRSVLDDGGWTHWLEVPSINYVEQEETS